MSKPPNARNLANGTYVNVPPVRQLNEGVGRVELLRKFLFKRPAAALPTGAIPVHPIAPADLETRRDSEETHLYRIGHSTILMKFGRDYWITDPVFSARVSPSQWFGPKRFHPPPLAIGDLPRIKAVVISHNHYDHLDRAAVRALVPSVERFIVPLGVARYLRRWGVKAHQIVELDWWQSHRWAGVEVTATPSQHFSGRGMRDTNKSLWASFVFQYGGQQVFFGSDSGYFDGFKQIADRFGGFDITMLESGAYDTAWPNVHMTPEQCVQAHEDLGGGVLMPIHNATFSLAFHPWKEPLDRLAAQASKRGHVLLTPHIGEQVVVGAPVIANPWWADII